MLISVTKNNIYEFNVLEAKGDSNCQNNHSTNYEWIHSHCTCWWCWHFLNIGLSLGKVGGVIRNYQDDFRKLSNLKYQRYEWDHCCGHTLKMCAESLRQWCSWGETTYVTSLTVAMNYKGKQTTCSSFPYIMYEYTQMHWTRSDQDNR